MSAPAEIPAALPAALPAPRPSLGLAFLTRPITWQGHLVRWFTGAPVHCEPVFDDGRGFRAIYGKPCAFVGPEAYASPDWRVLDLTPLYLDAASARALCASYDGTAYDTPRALFGWWLGLDTVGRVICSEVCAEAIAGAVTDRTPAGVRDALQGLRTRASTTPRRLLAALEPILEEAIEDRGVQLLRGQGYAFTPPALLARRER